MDKFDKAWALGRWPDDDPMARAWIKASHAHHVEVEQSSNIVRVAPKLSTQSVVLLRYGLDVAEKTFKQLISTPAKLIVYLPEGGREIAPREAVDLCKKNVLTILMQRDGLPEWFARHLEHLYGGRCMYRTIQVALQAGKSRPDSCFLSSPYSGVGVEFQRAAAAGLEGRGIQIRDPRGVQTSGTVDQKIEHHIHEVDFIVADTRGLNPNVVLEIGMAIGRYKTAVLSTHAADPQLPSDLQGREYLKYWNELDLTMKLYWGFRWVDGIE